MNLEKESFVRFSGNKILNRVFCFLFAILLFAPLLGEKETKSFEKRDLTEFPEFDPGYVWGFFKGFGNYFNDRFAFRNLLIKNYSEIKYNWFSTSPIPEKVIKGENNYLYFNDHQSQIKLSDRVTEQELHEIKKILHSIHTKFTERGIQHVFFFTNVKANIYPEYLPDFHRLDYQYSLIEEVLSDTTFGISNYSFAAMNELFEEKPTKQLYFKGDTHWNQHGGFIGYKKIMNFLSTKVDSIQSFDESDYSINEEVVARGDLLKMLGMKDLIPLQFVSYQLKEERPFEKYDRYPKYPVNRPVLCFETPNAPNHQKMLLMRDSFGNALLPFLRSTFKESLFYWSDKIPFDIIEKEKPQIIIHEINERYLRKIEHTRLNILNPENINSEKGII